MYVCGNTHALRRAGGNKQLKSTKHTVTSINKNASFPIEAFDLWDDTIAPPNIDASP